MGRGGGLFQGGPGQGGGTGADKRDGPGGWARECRPGGIRSWRFMLFLFRAVPSLFGHRGAERKPGHVRPALPQALHTAFRPEGSVWQAGRPVCPAPAREVPALHPGPVRLPASKGDRPLAGGIFEGRGPDEVAGIRGHSDKHLSKSAGWHRQG